MGTEDKTKLKKKTKKAKVRIFQRKVKGDSEKNLINKLVAKYEEVM